MNSADILLVDDDADCCAAMADILADLGYSVGVAYDGPAALECYQRKAFRLALLDYKMPGMDGLEVSRRLKGSQPPPAVVLVTAFAPDAAAAAEAGIRQVLTKPVNFGVLLPLVHEVLDGSAEGAT